MVQRSEDQKFKDISKYAEALSSFKEPEGLTKNAKNFTVHSNSLIEEYFRFVAQNGRTELEWPQIRDVFLWKLKTVINDMKAKSSVDASFKENEDKKRTENMIQFICSRFEAFTEAPFTIQRICELLIWPNRHYSSLGPFLRALEKTINVISCVQSNGDRVINSNGTGIEEEMDIDGDDIRVESSFMVRVDELEMDKPLPSDGASPKPNATRQTVVHIAPPLPPESHFATPELLASKTNVDLNDIVTYALPIGPSLPTSNKQENAEETEEVDDQKE